MKAKIFGLVFLCVGLMIQGPSIAEEHHEHDEKSEHEQKAGKEHQDEYQDEKHEDEHKDKEHQHGDHEEKGSKEEEHGHGEEEESTGGVGPNNAVTAADEHEGIKLSPKAAEFIELKTEAYNGQMISKAALVLYQDKVGVYRLRDGWFKLVPVAFSLSEASVPQSEDLRPGDQIVVEGTGLLRVAELDAFSGEVGHSH